MTRLKRIWDSCRNHGIWLALLLFTDILFSLFLWLMDSRSFWVLSGLMVFFSLGLFAAALFYVCRKEVKQEGAIRDFLETPDKEHEMDACGLLSPREQRQICLAGAQLREKEALLKEQKAQLEDYEDYIESWAHEVKNPLSLLTLVLENRKEELPLPIYRRLEYVRGQIQEYVDQILYYGRLKAAHKDHLFEKVLLAECCQEAMAEFKMLFQEQNFKIIEQLPEIEVVTDKKSFSFVLSQVISNAIKYRDPEKERPTLHVKAWLDEKDKGVWLSIKDNGLGVKPYDLPFIFEKGFCGETDQQRKKTTGMGLYLVKEIAEELNIRVDARSQYLVGMEILFQFPLV